MGVKVGIEGKNNADFLRNLMVGFIVIFLMTYGVVLAEYNMAYNDYYPHTEWAIMMNWHKPGEYFRNIISYPLWHFGVKFCVRVLTIDANKSAALVTALLNCFAYVSVVGVWKATHAMQIQKEKVVFWAVSLLLINPLYAPWINPNYYPGQAAPNVWHNPTNIAVKGFAVISFGLLISFLNNKEKNKNVFRYLLLSVILILSSLAKPSFLQGFIPGLGLFIIIRIFLEKKKFNIKFYVKLCTAFIPAVVLLFFQSFAAFFNTDSIRVESKICIGWGNVLYNWTPSLLYSFLATFAFPIFVLLINFKKLICKEAIQLMLCYEAAAWLESVLLYEDGIAFIHANFTWANLTSAFVVWSVMLYYFVLELYDPDGYDTVKKKVFAYGGISLFVAHLLFGIIYWYNIFTGI